MKIRHSIIHLTRRPWQAVAGAALTVLAGALCAGAQSTNDSSNGDFSSFQIIVQRNIFDPNRYPHESHHRESFHGVPTFSLAGTMSYRKGMFAFFSGTSSEYQKALQEGGTIAGYTVKKITLDGVQLENAGKEIELNVGSAMQQEGDGWKLSAGEWDSSASPDTTSENQGSQAAPEPSATLPSSGAANDALKRMMERRAQEEQTLK